VLQSSGVVSDLEQTKGAKSGLPIKRGLEDSLKVLIHYLGGISMNSSSLATETPIPPLTSPRLHHRFTIKSQLRLHLGASNDGSRVATHVRGPFGNRGYAETQKDLCAGRPSRLPKADTDTDTDTNR